MPRFAFKLNGITRADLKRDVMQARTYQQPSINQGHIRRPLPEADMSRINMHQAAKEQQFGL